MSSAITWADVASYNGNHVAWNSALQLIVLNYCKQNIDIQRFTAILAWSDRYLSENFDLPFIVIPNFSLSNCWIPYAS